MNNSIPLNSPIYFHTISSFYRMSYSNYHMKMSLYPVQSRCISSGFPLSLFLKLTSQKPVIRNPNGILTPSNNNYIIRNPFRYNLMGAWYMLNGPCSIIVKNLHRESLFKSRIKNHLLISSTNSVIYKYDDNNYVKYCISRWLPLTSRLSILSYYPFQTGNIELLPDNRFPILRSQYNNIGLGIVLAPPSSRIKSINMSYALKYSYYRDIRFVLFLLILFGFTIWIFLAPDPHY